MIADRRQRKHREVRRALSAVLLAVGLIVLFDVRPLAAASVSGTKAVSGSFTPAYTVVLTNISGSAQLDNPGNEFIDILPSQLTLVSASITSGTAVATVATNTVIGMA